jgi:lysophospholipase L1-like esterase
VILDALSVSAQPRELKVGSHILKDVLVGEVWLCSGQSNMEMPVGDLENATYNGGGAYRGVENWRQETALPDRVELRLFRDDKQPAWKARGWRHCEGEDLSSFSATAYFFGKVLQSKLDVPVGLIDVSRGGASIQSWTPKNFALLNPVTRYYANVFQQHRDQINAFNQANEKARLAREAGKKDSVFPPPLPPDLALANRFGGVASLFDHFIEPLAPFAVRGTVWYQGESNGDCPESAQAYDSMLRDLIDGWRARWGKPQMSWFLVQLPGWNSPYSVHWPWVRQGQLIASQNIPRVSLVTTCDLGDGADLHPPQKSEVGERLAKLVLARTYGKNLVCSGPVVKSVCRSDAKLCVEFATGGAPIYLKGGAWNNVEIAGEDAVFHPATATFTNAVAMVLSDAVKYPCALRYGWTNEFRSSLFNEAGLPASPFALVVEPGGTFRFLSQEGSLFHPSDRWCAIGDSITHSDGYLKTIYLYCATRFPNVRFDLFNCGCGGDTAAGTLRRMDRDILIHAPTLSTVMLGINDIWWEHGGLIGSNDYIRDLGRIVDRLQSANSDVILVTPSPYDATARSPEPLDPKRADLECYVNQLRALAVERAIPVVDLFQVMSEITSREQAKDPAFTLLAPDRIHPNATGNFVIAGSFLKTLRAPQYVSRVVLDAANLKSLLVENATLDKLSSGDDSISFNLLENALPFPSSEIPEASLPLVNFNQDFNQEILQVIGLKEGQYELTIDGVHAGVFSSANLLKGINVATIAETPQNRQATRVAELNNKRSQIISEQERHIAMIEYGEFKTNYIIDDIVSPRRALKLILNVNQDVKRTTGTATAFEKYFSLKSQQSKFLQQSQDYDDQIWQGNTPRTHHWQLNLKK